MSYAVYSAGITIAFLLGVVAGFMLAVKITQGGNDDE